MQLGIHLEMQCEEQIEFDYDKWITDCVECFEEMAPGKGRTIFDLHREKTDPNSRVLWHPEKQLGVEASDPNKPEPKVFFWKPRVAEKRRSNMTQPTNRGYNPIPNNLKGAPSSVPKIHDKLLDAIKELTTAMQELTSAIETLTHEISIPNAPSPPTIKA